MAEPWKNAITSESVAVLGAALLASYPSFDPASFHARVMYGSWKDRGLMDRLRHISSAMREFLSADYAKALSVLRDASPRMDGHNLQNLVFPEFVAAYGLADWEASMAAIEQFTQQTTGEFAVRPFIVADQPRMLAQMLAWTGHESHHVRRLASEGSRPRLPWGIALRALQEDPTPLIPILEALRLDGSEYVRKSVANNLNEIAKDHPDLVVEILGDWQAEAGAAVERITKHALRTLVKRGHPGALELLGYRPSPGVDVRSLRVDPDPVPWGETVRFSFDIHSHVDEEQGLLIDFVVYLMRANGGQTAKVFKLTQRSIGPGEVLRVEKAFSFRPVSSRRYYPGEHAIAPKINGREFERARFIVLEET